MTERSLSKVWIEAMRLRTLPVGAASVVAGSGAAAFAGSFRLLPAAICFCFALLAQIASNFANEYYDYRSGLDRKGREGFRRGVTEGDISPRAMQRATFGTLALSALLGLSLIYWGGWWLLIPGVAIALFALGYSTGPYPLSHHGLGDVAVVIFFGLVPVSLTCYVQAGWMAAFSPMTLTVALSVGLLAANVLMVNNYRDADDDRAVGKHTTAVIFGRRILGMTYLLSGLAAAALGAAACMPVLAAGWWTLFGVLAVVYFLLYKRLVTHSGAALNPQLGMTAVTLLLYTIALTIALATAH